MEKAQLKRETRARKVWAFLTAFCLLVSVIFLILVEVGSTAENRLPNVYFIRLDLSQIVPQTLPNYQLINSVAQTLGLHDWYQVGLWNYCAGNHGQGFDYCTTPRTLFWFNPIEVIQSELLQGATIAYPTEIQDILDLLQKASQWMFGLFLTGACLNFVMIFITPLAIFSKLLTIPIAIFTFLGALTTTVAVVLGTVIFIVMRNAVRDQQNLNISGKIGIEMFVFMWIAAGFAIAAFLIQLFLLCCCRSRRKAKKEWRQSMGNGSRRASMNEAEKEDASMRRQS